MTLVETTPIINATHGETICVPATWIDVAKFIGLNYVTHAFTVVVPAGAPVWKMALWVQFSLLMPMFATAQALRPITRFFKLRWQNGRLRGFSPLTIAAHANALRIVIGFDKLGIAQVPTAFKGRDHKEFHHWYMDSEIGTFHGQLPVIQTHGSIRQTDQESAKDDLSYYCFRLPKSWYATVRPMNQEIGSFELSQQHNVVRAFAAIVQIFFASKELYDARGRQIERYGYGAFGLTVLPYLWMSFLNFVANICEPQYSHKYIVYYRGRHEEASDPEGDGQNDPLITAGDGQASEDRAFEAKIVGAVGAVYGEPNDLFIPGDEWKDILPTTPPGALGWALACISLVAPYIAIYALTGFQKARSTVSQRLAVIGWLAAGQITALGEVMPTVETNNSRHLALRTVLRFILQIIAGFFGGWAIDTVAQMIVENGACFYL